MRLHQCHVSDSLSIFRDGFLKRWELEPYTNPNLPALFVGAYNSVNDIKRINDHKGFKLVLFGGADIPNVRMLNKGIHIVTDSFTYEHSLRRYLKLPYNYRFIRVAFKDYSDFNKVPLGSKIYCYQSQPTPACQQKYGFDLLRVVIDYFGAENVLVGYHGHTIKEMIDYYYSRSFVNLQLNPMAGFTTALEMAHMGRMTVSNHAAPFCLPFRSQAELIWQIKIVKEKSIEADPSRFLHNSDDWLYTEYWN